MRLESYSWTAVALFEIITTQHRDRMGCTQRHGLVAHDDLDVFGPKCMRPTEAPCRAWGIRLTIMKLNRNVTQSSSQNVGVSVWGPFSLK